MSKQFDAMRSRVDREYSPPGRLNEYLAQLRLDNPEGAESLMDDLKKTFSTEEGLRVLLLFEKSIFFRANPVECSDRALQHDNSLRNFHLELRRLITHG